MSSSNSRNMDALGRDDGDRAASNDPLEQKKSFFREMIEIDEEARAKGTVVSSPLSDEEKGPHNVDPWMQFRSFTGPDPFLTGRTPIAALKDGNVTAAVNAARRFAEMEQGGS